MEASTSCVVLNREGSSMEIVDPFQGVVHRRAFAEPERKENAGCSPTSKVEDVFPPKDYVTPGLCEGEYKPHLLLRDSATSQCGGSGGFRDFFSNLAAGASTSCRQFLYGFLFRCCSGIALEVALVVGLDAIEVLSPGAGTTVRLALISWLRCIGCIGTTARQVLVAPFLFVALLPIFIVKALCGPTWIVTCVSDATLMACMDPSPLQTPSLIQLLEEPSSSWIVRAICEEVTFRFIMNWPLWVGQRLFSNSSRWNLLCWQQEKEKQQTVAPLSHSPLVIVKGLCFGAMQIEHWLIDGSVHDATSNVQLRAISGAIHQSLWCFVASIRIFDPLARKYGLMAAIGAHATHNTLGFGLKAIVRMVAGE